MDRLSAYVLAADPTWLEHSVQSYYPHVERIVVSYDTAGKGWTGAPIPVDECIRRLKAIDGDRKMRFVGGDFSGAVKDPMENDTRQRSVAFDLASEDADWVLQIDTDEWIPDPRCLLEGIRKVQALGLHALEWPMRVLYRKLATGQFLEVCANDGLAHFEYIAPVVVRAGSRLVHSRRTNESFLRAVVRGDRRSIQLKRPCALGEVREEILDPAQAIVHNSWARSPAELRRKIRSWGHSSPRAWLYYATTWLPSVWFWKQMKNMHPFFGEVWPALRIAECSIPSEIKTETDLEEPAPSIPLQRR